MINQLVSFLGRTLQPQKSSSIKKTEFQTNPFLSSENPFINSYGENRSNPFYGKNKPVSGGYFAGYYNGKPNIVGTRLFVEV